MVRVSGFSTYTCLPRSMPHIAAVPCMKSGMAMITASMALSSLSSILRKSVYFAALPYLVKLPAARAESGSASATMFSDEHPSMSSAARPPAPIDAILSFSLGDLKPAALSDGVLPNPPAGTAPAIRAPWKKRRLENRLLAMDGLYANFGPITTLESRPGRGNRQTLAADRH